jgi:imidazolonepropionase-like amidohydrolase
MKESKSVVSRGTLLFPRRAILNAVGAAVVAAAIAGCTPAASDDVQVYRDFVLIDGTESAPLQDAAMVVTDGRISWVGPASELETPAGAETTSLEGRYVIPGLIDTHVHLANVQDMVQDRAFFTRESVERELGVYARYGVTTVQSLGTDSDPIFEIRAEQRADGRPSVSRIYTSGRGLVFQGGYGGLAGVNVPISTVEEVNAQVDQLAARGVDVVKFWLDDELGSMPKMPPEISQAIIDAAHRNNLRAVAHIFYLEDARRLVDQGIDGFAHSVRDQAIDPALIASMRDRGVWQMAATLSREAAIFTYGEDAPFLHDRFFTQQVSPRTIEVLSDAERQRGIATGPHYADYQRFLQTAQENLLRLRDGGVRYAYGTDAGPPGRFPGFADHWELQLMVEAGFTPAQAIQSATRHAAEFLGADDLGTLETSKWADFVVVDTDPLADVANLRDISRVYIAGRQVPSVDR